LLPRLSITYLCNGYPPLEICTAWAQLKIYFFISATPHIVSLSLVSISKTLKIILGSHTLIIKGVSALQDTAKLLLSDADNVVTVQVILGVRAQSNLTYAVQVRLEYQRPEYMTSPRLT
jgi:hypothetical protein